MAVSNPYISKYQLVTPFLDENQFWIATSETSPIYIDFAKVTDDELDYLVPRYPDWAAPLVELVVLTGTMEFGGPLFTNNLPFAIETQTNTFVPVATNIMPGTTLDGDTIVGFDYYLSDVNPPNGTVGILDAAILAGVTDVSYIGGTYPSYIEKLLAQDVGLAYYEITDIPATLIYIDLKDNFLDHTIIDAILNEVDQAGGIDGYIDFTGTYMGTPTVSATITSLQGKGWDINTN